MQLNTRSSHYSGFMLALLMIFWSAFLPAGAQEVGVCLAGVSAQEGDDAQLSVRTSTKFWLHICGKKENAFGKDLYSEFDLVEDNGKARKKISFPVGTSERFFATKTAMGFDLFEAVLMDDHWLPLFKRSVTCPKSGCKVGNVRCANQKPSHKAKSAKQLISFYQKESVKRSSTGQATDPTEIDVALAAAISGEVIAIEAFQKNPGFRLEGASEERYLYGQSLLKRLRRMKCKYQ